MNACDAIMNAGRQRWLDWNNNGIPKFLGEKGIRLRLGIM